MWNALEFPPLFTFLNLDELFLGNFARGTPPQCHVSLGNSWPFEGVMNKPSLFLSNPARMALPWTIHESFPDWFNHQTKSTPVFHCQWKLISLIKKKRVKFHKFNPFSPQYNSHNKLKLNQGSTTISPVFRDFPHRLSIVFQFFSTITPATWDCTGLWGAFPVRMTGPGVTKCSQEIDFSDAW